MIGLFGGTFDPIHHGHIFVADETRKRFDLSKVIFIPSGIPPHKQDGSNAMHRYNMVELAIKDNPHFDISDIEITSGHTNYTIDTLKKLKNMLPDKFRFIIGLDAFLYIMEWTKNVGDYGEILELLRLANFIVVKRFGVSFGDLHKLKHLHPQFDKGLARYDEALKPEVNIVMDTGGIVTLFPLPMYLLSSTDVRNKIAKDREPTWLIHPNVLEYIEKWELYK